MYRIDTLATTPSGDPAFAHRRSGRIKNMYERIIIIIISIACSTEEFRSNKYNKREHARARCMHPHVHACLTVLVSGVYGCLRLRAQGESEVVGWRCVNRMLLLYTRLYYFRRLNDKYTHSDRERDVAAEGYLLHILYSSRRRRCQNRSSSEKGMMCVCVCECGGEHMIPEVPGTRCLAREREDRREEGDGFSTNFN